MSPRHPNDENYYCIAIGPDDLSAEDLQTLSGQRAALWNKTRWDPNPSITVSFMEGDPGLRNRVKDAALGWTKRGIARVTLVFQDPGPTNIRIAFQPGRGSSSYIGIICRQIAIDKPTMNFGWLTPSSTTAQIRLYRGVDL